MSMVSCAEVKRRLAFSETATLPSDGSYQTRCGDSCRQCGLACDSFNPARTQQVKEDGIWEDGCTR